MQLSLFISSDSGTTLAHKLNDCVQGLRGIDPTIHLVVAEPDQVICLFAKFLDVGWNLARN
jgi:hypothetical protein